MLYVINSAWKNFRSGWIQLLTWMKPVAKQLSMAKGHSAPISTVEALQSQHSSSHSLSTSPRRPFDSIFLVLRLSFSFTFSVICLLFQGPQWSNQKSTLWYSFTKSQLPCFCAHRLCCMICEKGWVTPLSSMAPPLLAFWIAYSRRLLLQLPPPSPE